MNKNLTLKLKTFAVAFGILISVNHTSAQTACFSNPAINLPSGGGGASRGIASGDLNNDGLTDFVVTNMNNSSISLMLGNGNGSIGSVSPVTLGGGGSLNSPRSVTIADFDNDGKKDVVVAMSGLDCIFFCKGNGTGSISSSTQISLPANSPWSVASKDFDGDGNMDIVTANFNSDDISIGKGDGTGGFSFTNYFVGNGPYFVEIAKMNNDNAWDVVVANSGSDQIAVALGIGNGTFGASASYGLQFGTSPYSLTVADFNNDGFNDVATAGHGNGVFSVSMGSGTGALSFGTNTTIGGSPFGITSGYYNSDNILDLAISNNTSNKVDIYAGDGLGGFTSNSMQTLSPLALIISGDYNGDGYDDIATTNNSSGGAFVLLNHRVKITASGPTSFCQGDSVLLVANHGEGFNYTWMPGSTTNDSLVVKSSADYTLTISNSNAGACTTSATQTIVVNPLPTVTGIATPSTACKGQQVTLNGTGAQTYTWSNGQTNGVPFTPSIAATYTVTGTDANGCSNTATTAINLYTHNLSFSVSPQNGVAPLPVTFTNNTPNLTNYNFTWYFGDGTSVNNNNNFVFYTYNFAGLYNIALVATNTLTGCTDTLVKPSYLNVTGTGCSHTASASTTGSLNKCQGDTIILTASTNAISPYTYQWNINSAAISGANSNTISVTQNGYYSVTILKNGCPVTSLAQQASFGAIPQQPTISAIGQITPCVGGSETLVSSPISGENYLWSTGVTTQSITVTNSGNYHVTVTNAAGCKSTSLSYTVNATLAIPNICEVTVDSLSQYNNIIWDKTSYTSVDSFIVYREVSTNNYKRIGAQDRYSLSVFIDTARSVGPANGNPNITSYRYKLQLRDTCGNYSILSPYHNSVYFISNTTGTYFWNTYNVEFQSLTPVSTFDLMRDNNATGTWTLVGSCAGTQTSLNDGAYSSYPNAIYRVIGNGFNCNPTARTLQQVNKSKSNVKNNFNVPLGLNALKANENFIISPNPATTELFVLFNDGIKLKTIITITDVLGKTISNNEFYEGNKMNIPVNELTTGIYFIKIKQGNNLTVKKFVKE